MDERRGVSYSLLSVLMRLTRVLELFVELFPSNFSHNSWIEIILRHFEVVLSFLLFSLVTLNYMLWKYSVSTERYFILLLLKSSYNKSSSSLWNQKKYVIILVVIIFLCFPFLPKRSLPSPSSTLHSSSSFLGCGFDAFIRHHHFWRWCSVPWKGCSRRAMREDGWMQAGSGWCKIRYGRPKHEMGITTTASPHLRKWAFQKWCFSLYVLRTKELSVRRREHF